LSRPEAQAPRACAVFSCTAGQTRAAVEKLLWSQVPALPLFQPVSLLVSTASADAGTGVGPGPLTTGPLTGAPRWTEPAR